MSNTNNTNQSAQQKSNNQNQNQPQKINPTSEAELLKQKEAEEAAKKEHEEVQEQMMIKFRREMQGFDYEPEERFKKYSFLQATQKPIQTQTAQPDQPVPQKVDQVKIRQPITSTIPKNPTQQNTDKQ